MKTLNIYYLDDSEILTDIFKAYFYQKGYKITTSNSISEDNYHMLENYDIIFLDFDLGRKAKHNGGEICYIIKKMNKNKKVYIFSSHNELDIVKFEADGFIEKIPYAYNKIDEIIRRETMNC